MKIFFSRKKENNNQNVLDSKKSLCAFPGPEGATPPLHLSLFRERGGAELALTPGGVGGR